MWPTQGLDGRAAAELAFDHPEHPTFLAGDEDAARAFRLVAARALFDVGALDRAAGERLGAFDDLAERVPQGLPGSALACSTNWRPGGR